jgi:trehalose-phosphatase
LKDVRGRIGVPGITYVGNHGLEIENPVRSHRTAFLSVSESELKSITRHLQISLKEIPGVLFEEKGPILSVHYRNVPRRFLRQVRQGVETELERWGNRWKITSGKMVLEIWPKIDFNKGEAVREILGSFSPMEVLPIYLGDDQTDEEAFRVVKDRGISVYVGPGNASSEADFFLQDPYEVQEFLSRCQKVRRSGRHPPRAT